MTSPSVSAVFVDVEVQACADLPESLHMRWKTRTAARPVAKVRFEPDDAPEGEFAVRAVLQSGERVPAQTCEVDDSSAGSSWLVWGGDCGLELRCGEVVVREPYLLLGPDEILD
jgi:hypothetical protein